MLSNLSLWLEDRGFVNEELITSSLASLSTNELNVLRDEFEAVLRLEKLQQDKSAGSIFDFVASSSFRGERCCIYADCRMKKSPQVFEFAALYAEHLYLPLDIGHKNDTKDRLEGSLRMAHFMRPLIDAGIVIPSSGALYFCKECQEKVIGASSKLGEISRSLAEAHVGQFHAIARYISGNKEALLVELEGPLDYFESGKAAFITHKFPAWARNLTEKTSLSKSEILEVGALRRVFAHSIKDFVLQHHYKEFLGTSYLTDLPCETEFFKAVRGQNEAESWQTAVLQKLNHKIPIFENLPLESLIGLRNEEEFAFKNYRNAVSKAIRLAPRGGDPDLAARDIWEQEIRPEVERLQSKANISRSSFRRNLASRAVPAAVIVGVGLLGSTVPATISHAIDLIAGCSLIKDLLPKRQENVEEQLGSEDYYFLLRASERSDA